MRKFQVSILIFVVSFLLLPSVSSAEWTKTDTALQLTYTALHLIDWGQTRDTAKNPHKFSENNLYLGKHPSVGKVDTYFIATLIGHTTVSYLLPSKYRRWWQVGWIGFEGGIIIHNISIGLKINF